MPNRRCPFPVVPVYHWPQADQDAWRRATATGGLLDERGVLSDLSEGRLNLLRMAFGRWVGYSYAVLGTGFLAPPVVDHLRRFTDGLTATLAPLTMVSYLVDLGVVLNVLHPEFDLTSLHAAVRNLAAAATPVREKRLALPPAADLYHAGQALMVHADTHADPLKGAVAFRDGLLIAMLAARPIRLANLSNMDLDRHITFVGDHYWLRFPADAVKNRRPLEIPLPVAMSASVDGYLEKHRSILLKQQGHWHRGDHNGFWVSIHGSKMRPAAIRDMVRRRTKAWFGKELTPHRFRDSVATSIAAEDPAHVQIIKEVLGHSSLRTGQQYYNQASALEAARRYHGAIRKFQTPQPGRPSQ